MISQPENHHLQQLEFLQQQYDLIFEYAKKSVKIEPISVGLWQLLSLNTWL